MTGTVTEGMIMFMCVQLSIMIFIIILTAPLSIPLILILTIYRRWVLKQKYKNYYGIFGFPEYVGWLLYGDRIYEH